ncbi:YdcF family protein [Sphingomonas sp. So64.6b]|uniref:YdcF family protein n=1 Tax=Sphingomonas sp. So64.6b TaxID=2997354 RepID=UPI0016041142|nr:YdcF family protein [Sphingomonas sp. So64.6b]QNA85772.1 YdcF family protein [Sphingomonas sp. So64.6b]
MIWRTLCVAAILWLLGFALFMLALPKPLDDVMTDAIVVPTGGAGRIDRGLVLLKAKAAKRMLITGVAPEVRPVELAVAYKSSLKLFECCIDLGHEAVDTRSNAEETARWVREHQYKSVRLVTSDWHVARAQLELVYALGDDVTVVGDGVPSNPRFALLIAEYNKLLLRRVALWLGVLGIGIGQ